MASSSPNLPPFSIRFFLPDGTSDGLRIVEKSNWTGVGVVVPRALFQQSKARDEFSRTGIYVLVGSDYVLVGSDEESDVLLLYVGQTSASATQPPEPTVRKYRNSRLTFL